MASTKTKISEISQPSFWIAHIHVHIIQKVAPMTQIDFPNKKMLNW